MSYLVKASTFQMWSMIHPVSYSILITPTMTAACIVALCFPERISPEFSPLCSSQSPHSMANWPPNWQIRSGMPTTPSVFHFLWQFMISSDGIGTSLPMRCSLYGTAYTNELTIPTICGCQRCWIMSFLRPLHPTSHPQTLMA